MSPAAWPVKLVPFSALRVWATSAGRVQPTTGMSRMSAARSAAAAAVGDVAGGGGGEAGAVLGVEGLGDLGGQGPADNGDVEDVGGAQRRGGGGRMVGMAGDARGVEDHERLRRHRTRPGKHVTTTTDIPTSLSAPSG